MNELKRMKTNSFLDENISFFQTQVEALATDDRTDEANFAKIQLNIFSLFSSVFSAASRYAGDNDARLCSFFREKLQQIPQNWHSALQKAQKHHDAERAHIEQLKLTAAEQIHTAFDMIWEE